MLCLHTLQSSLGFVNTLMIQDVLAEPEWADVLGDADRRGLTPLFTSNMTPYGDIQLDTSRRLDLGTLRPSNRPKPPNPTTSNSNGWSHNHGSKTPAPDGGPSGVSAGEPDAVSSQNLTPKCCSETLLRDKILRARWVPVDQGRTELAEQQIQPQRHHDGTWVRSCVDHSPRPRTPACRARRARHSQRADLRRQKTGATIDRPGFTELLRYARDGDSTVAVTLDRLGRNLRECLNIIYELREQGIGIKTLNDPIPIDTTDDSPMAELAVALLALFAHMERVFMRERAAHAREVAATKGKRPGRPRKLDPDQLDAARAALAAKQRPDRVAAAFGVSRATLYRYLAEDQEPQTLDKQ
jgi:DNA invertase Pin-like site-specific DNA recombinase